MKITHLTDLNLTGKRVFIRSDLNVPIEKGKITSYARINASLPTIKTALKQGANVIIASHLGRPTEGNYEDQFSLQLVLNYLQDMLSTKIRFVKDYLNGIDISKNELILLENVRFNKGEKNNDEKLAKQYAALCDIFVMDAFGTAHRTHASTYGVGQFVPIVCAGLLFSNELKILSKALNNPVRPMITIVGGSKISTKLKVLKNLSKVSDQVIVGGGIANTLLAAQGYNIGKSLFELNLLQKAKQLLKYKNIMLPTDVRVSINFPHTAISILKSVKDVKNNEQILDLGNVSADFFAKILKTAKTILWNGPVGVFEFTQFSKGTEILARAIADSNAFSVAGGGDTIAAIELFNIADNISYISTGGGSFLAFIEGKTLPVVKMLETYNK